MNSDINHLVRGNVLEIIFKDQKCDATNASAVKAKIFELIEQTGLSKVIINLNHLHFIDSSGLGALLAIQRHLYNEGGKLKIACLNKQVQTVFEIVSMHKIFEVYPSIDEAIKSF